MQARRSSWSFARARRARWLPPIPAAISMAALLLGIIPAACLSDIPLDPCFAQMSCGAGAGYLAAAGAAGELAEGGSAGDQTPSAGSANAPSGALGGLAGAGGTSGSGAVAGGGGDTVCHTCAFSRLELPNPCGSDPYSTELAVFGGVAPYSWSVTASGGTWNVMPKTTSADHSPTTLTGTAAGVTDITVKVIDSKGYQAERLYSVTPRTSCYFAYVAKDVNGPKLALGDPMLGIDATAHVTHNQAVYDFQFSSNGRFLAYRYGESPVHPHGAHLALLDLSTMQDQALPFAEDSVDAYAWSPDSKVLAVAFNASGVSELSGVRLASASGNTQVTPLTSVVANDPIESKLIWVDTRFVTFFSATTPDLFVPPGQSSVFYASLSPSATAFDSPMAIEDFAYDAGFVATAAPGGLFVTSPDDGKSEYNAVILDGSYVVDHGTNVVDPAGRFSAAVVNKTLTLFHAAEKPLPGTLPFETSGRDSFSNCPKLLTWAKGRERIACVATVTQASTSTSWGDIRIFDAGSATPFEIMPSHVNGACIKNAQGVPLASQCSASEYDYDETTSAGQPRLLSPSGAWLAFQTGAQSGALGALYWANLGTMPVNGTTMVNLSRKFTTQITNTGSPVALAFSPSERYLLSQNGNELGFHLLSAAANGGGDFTITVNPGFPAAAPCSEDFTTAPTRWCGGANNNPLFTWSPDRAFDDVAYRVGDNLEIVELARGSLSSPHRFAASLCDATCSGQYAFQPPNP